MAGQEIATIDLPKSIIAPIVQAQLQASILSALGGAEQLVGQVVQSIMNKQVDSDGKATNSSYNAQPMITWMCEKAIKEAAQEAIKEWFEQHKPKIKEHITAALIKNSKGMAEALITSLITGVSASSKYNFEISFKPTGEKRY